MNTEDKAKKLDEVIDLLNNDNSLSLTAYDYNIVECVEELINLYQESEERIEEVNNFLGSYKYRT